MTLEELVSEYKQKQKDLSQAVKAALESSIWQQRPTSTDILRPIRTTFLSQLLDVSSSDLVARYQIFHFLPATQPLADRVEKDFSLGTCSNLFQAARKKQQDNTSISFQLAIQQVVAEYDARPIRKMLANGKIARLRSKGVEVKEKPPESKAYSGAAIRQEVTKYILTKIPDCPEHVREQLLRDFDKDLSILVEEFQRKVYKASKDDRGSILADMRRTHIINACRTLSMEPGKPGKPVDLVLAKKQQRKLAKLYHPDQHSGDNSMVGLYKGVMEAFELLENYNQSLSEAQNASSASE